MRLDSRFGRLNQTHRDCPLTYQNLNPTTPEKAYITLFGLSFQANVLGVSLVSGSATKISIWQRFFHWYVWVTLRIPITA